MSHTQHMKQQNYEFIQTYKTYKDIKLKLVKIVNNSSTKLSALVKICVMFLKNFFRLSKKSTPRQGQFCTSKQGSIVSGTIHTQYH